MLMRIVCAITLLGAAAAHGQTRYVDDELVIMLRTGPSNRNAIIRSLESGERVEVLESNGEGYSRVRVASDGNEGWVLNQYLSEEPVAADRLAEAERALRTANERVAELEERAAGLSAELESTSGELEAAGAESERLAAELREVRSASANALATRDENDSLRQRVGALTRQLDTARMVNAELQSRSRQNWFVVGAGVLLAGVVIGLVAPSLRRRRRTNW